MTQSPPSHTHIKLDSLNVRTILRFIEKINEYEIAHKVSLPIPTMITETPRRHLISKRDGMTTAKFFDLTKEEVFKLLLKEVRPDSALIFQKSLENNVRFDQPPNYVPTASDFGPFYDALLMYKHDFLMIFDLLAEKNKKNIPPINNKEGGIINTFVKLIPHDYGKRILMTMKVTKFKDIYEFLTLFYAIVKKHKEDFKKTKMMNQYFSRSPAQTLQTPAKASQRPSGFVKRQKINELGFIDELLDQDFPDQPDAFLPDDLNILADEVLHEEDVQAPPETFEFQSDAELELQELDNITSNVKILPRDMKPMKGPASSAKKPGYSNERPNCCFNMLFEGSCSAGELCRRPHDTSSLVAGWHYYRSRLDNSKFRPKSGAKTLNSVCLSIEPMHVPDSMDFLLNEFAHDTPEAALLKAVHHKGTVTTADDLTFLVDDILFDSGALSGSFISREFVNLHLAELESSRSSIQAQVVLADKKTRVNIDTAYSLTISFLDDSGDSHAALVYFYVLPNCNHQIIIGLPAIVRHFSSLHFKMLAGAVALLSDIGPERNILNEIQIGEVRYPWTYVQEDIAPEDEATPLPCSFTDALHYMEVSYDEAVVEYLGLLNTHVSKDFVDNTDVLQLLKTKGVKVFVPQNWEGIQGIPDIELSWKDGLPDKVKPRARPVNPKLYAHAKNEFDRLMKYFYRESHSSIASCLVIAPKATAPFIRFCGDYVFINRYIVTGHYPIPNVKQTLERIIRFKIFLDFDLANSFHQFKLARSTSQRLSIQTPWGQVEPIFMPEGIGPASGILQKAMAEIFNDFVEQGWCIVIFDNLLVMAMDFEEAYQKTVLILDRCLKHNVYLKFSKTWLGFDKANFFGYVCRKDHYELSDERKETIRAFPFPINKKKMQSFLGTALFFSSFVPHYASVAAPLYDMIKNDFNWDESTWTKAYKPAFEAFKTALIDAVAIYYPDYELDWILRTDASMFGIGAVLLQIFHPSDGGDPIYQPIQFFAQKFSDQATRWSTIEQEAYAIYAAVLHLAYYLSCKPFLLETDHNNLLFMEQSVVPKIIRWRVYLQSFNFLLRHIPGKKNIVADWLSRWAEDSLPSVTAQADSVYQSDYASPASGATTLGFLHLGNMQEAYALFNLQQLEDHQQDETEPVVPIFRNPEEVLSQVHGGRMGHFGVRRTWKWLNDFFPGHHIPYRVVEDYISSCAVCQKDRLGMTDTIKPIVRHLKPPHQRSIVGIDTLTITPADSEGYKYIFVLVNHFTKYSVLVPSKDKSAESMATAFFNYVCTFGLFDSIATDPGTEFTNELLSLLNKWIGMRHIFSLVDHHESCGVEGTNKQILRHLKAMVFDERVLRDWRAQLYMIQYMLNSTDNSETGIKPFEAHFGSDAYVYCRMPEVGDGTVLASAYLQSLNENLKTLFEISKKHQDKLVEERTKSTPPEEQNQYQPGDLVLWQRDPDKPLPSKLSPKFVGPFIVLDQYKNDVSCRNVLHGYVETFHVSRLKIFHGDLEAAKKVAMLDNDQYMVKQLLAYVGDPNVRTSVTFKVEFEDGTIQWLKYSKDLFDSIPYEKFCRAHPELDPLLYDLATSKNIEKSLKERPITDVSPGDTFYADLRFFGHDWFDDLDLPDKETSQYLVEGRYFTWENKTHTKISVKFPIFNLVYTVSNVFVRRYGYLDALPTSNYYLVDRDLLKQFPALDLGKKVVKRSNSKN